MVGSTLRKIIGEIELEGAPEYSEYYTDFYVLLHLQSLAGGKQMCRGGCCDVWELSQGMLWLSS